MRMDGGGRNGELCSSRRRGGRVPSRGRTVCRPTFRRKPETVPNGALHYRQNFIFLMGLRRRESYILSKITSITFKWLAKHGSLQRHCATWACFWPSWRLRSRDTTWFLNVVPKPHGSEFSHILFKQGYWQPSISSLLYDCSMLSEIKEKAFSKPRVQRPWDVPCTGDLHTLGLLWRCA